MKENATAKTALSIPADRPKMFDGMHRRAGIHRAPETSHAGALDTEEWSRDIDRMFKLHPRVRALPWDWTSLRMSRMQPSGGGRGADLGAEPP